MEEKSVFVIKDVNSRDVDVWRLDRLEPRKDEDEY